MNIQKTILKQVNRVLAGILSLLGFIGCANQTLLEYGTPIADYTVKGAVVNKTTGKPIAGIRVGHSPENPATDNEAPAYYLSKTYVLTNAKGEFSLTGNSIAGVFPESSKYPLLSIYVEDVDGAENGLYESEKIQVDFNNATQTKKSKGWYCGEYTVNVNFGLASSDNN